MCLYPGDDGQARYLLSTAGGEKDPFRGFLYVCDLAEERPIEAIPNDPTVSVTHMHISKKKGGECLVLGYENGEV